MTTKNGLQHFFSERRHQQALVIMVFSLVPVTLLVLFTYLPFAKMVEFSFFKMKYIGPRTFVGLDNYAQVFSRTDTVKALLNCFYYMGAGVIQLSLSLFFACLLSFKLKGSSFFKATLFIPYLVCSLAVGFIFKFFYSRGLVLDTVLQGLGINLESLPYWLKDRAVNNYSIAATSIWRYMGQSMVLYIGAIQSISPEFFEASSIDGATQWQQFRYIMLPHLKPIVALTILLMIKGSFSAFEGPYVITYGMNGTATPVVLMHQLAHEANKVGLASAMAVVLLALILLVSWIQKIIEKRMGD
ncbi:MAG: sugar ABC transporter permease [Sphaerochaetaceae bacterium]|jgi:ABC-type sugar transport system permease subunit|nr:sugar ABC transporter permease [Sphaerochaetaceae bacterium]